MKNSIITIALLLTTLIGFSQTGDFDNLDQFFTALEDDNRFFGSVAVAKGGNIIYSNSIGYADLETELHNTAETKARIGSISKTFTAVLIMKAVEAGKINLDDKIATYFPRIKNADKISIRHLLNHQSGINTFTTRSFFSWYQEEISASRLLDTIVSKGIDFAPAEKYAYSNSNYVLLTFILEEIFNHSYADLLDQYIIDPLQLKHTAYGEKIDTELNEARSYRMKSDWTLEPEGHMSIPLGAGGIVSTPSDLCVFAKALFGGQLVSLNSLAQMKPVTDETYGFALEEMTINEMTGLGHLGGIDAFTSTLIHFEQDDLTFALTCNGANYGKHDVAKAVLSEIYGQPYEIPSFDYVELTSEELDQYIGTYSSDELPIDLTISKDGSKLMAKGTGQAAFELMSEGDHAFSSTAIGLKVTFVPAKNKLSFIQAGMEFEMAREVKAQSEKSKVSGTTTPIQNLEQYVGTYTSDELPMDLTIRQDGNSLIAQGTGQPSFPIKSEGGHNFSNKEIGLTITFLPQDQKLSFIQNGMAFDMAMK